MDLVALAQRRERHARGADVRVAVLVLDVVQHRELEARAVATVAHTLGKEAEHSRVGREGEALLVLVHRVKGVADGRGKGVLKVQELVVHVGARCLPVRAVTRR